MKDEQSALGVQARPRESTVHRMHAPPRGRISIFSWDYLVCFLRALTAFVERSTMLAASHQSRQHSGDI